jgi:hypothetical protein
MAECFALETHGSDIAAHIDDSLSRKPPHSGA